MRQGLARERRGRARRLLAPPRAAGSERRLRLPLGRGARRLLLLPRGVPQLRSSPGAARRGEEEGAPCEIPRAGDVDPRMGRQLPRQPRARQELRYRNGASHSQPHTLKENAVNRREFLQAAAAGTAALAFAPFDSGLPALAQDKQEAGPIWNVGGFTKVLQDLSYEKTAQAAVDVGWDGIECPVRAKGHVLPERVEEDLPKFAEALKAKGLEILVLATDLRGADEPHTEKVLKAAAKLGIRLYRVGPFRYKERSSIPKQLDEIRARLKDLAAMNKEIGVTGLMQNH